MSYWQGCGHGRQNMYHTGILKYVCKLCVAGGPGHVHFALGKFYNHGCFMHGGGLAGTNVPFLCCLLEDLFKSQTPCLCAEVLVLLILLISMPLLFFFQQTYLYAWEEAQIASTRWFTHKCLRWPGACPSSQVFHTSGRNPTTWAITSVFYNLCQQEAGVRSRRWGWSPGAPTWRTGVWNAKHPRLCSFLISETDINNSNNSNGHLYHHPYGQSATYQALSQALGFHYPS